MNNLYESIKTNLTEGTKYHCAPSFDDTEDYPFYSETNTEAIEMARDVANYFRDYANFLDSADDNVAFHYQGDVENASLFRDLADTLDNKIQAIFDKWENM